MPIDDDISRARLGWEVTDLPDRLRLIADAYGCTAIERVEMLAAVDYAVANHGELVRRRAEAGDPGFVAMWKAMGGAPRLDRRRDWWAQHHDEFAAALRP